MENKESYLPNWLLDFRKNINESKKLYSETNQRIEGLKLSAQVLSEKIKDEIDQQNEEQKHINRKILNISDLPLDLLLVIAGYLTVQSMINFFSSSKEIYLQTKNSLFWRSYFKELYPGQLLNQSTSSPSSLSTSSSLYRDFIIRQTQYGTISIRFIQIMKSNRFLSRTRSLDPFAQDLKYIPKSETMTKDFRSYALLSLRALYTLTCHEASLLHNELIQCNIVQVLISLFANESSLVQQYACEILSNIMCWESILFKGTGIVSNQIQICDGRRQLLSLLTSPSASVVLSQSIVHDHPYRNDMKNKKDNLDNNINNNINNTQNNTLNQTTSSVQGLANKSASKALVNYFCTDYPVLSSSRNDYFLKPGELFEPSTIQDSNCNNNNKISFNENILQHKIIITIQWKFFYYHRSGFIKDSHDVWLTYSLDRHSLQGRGIDNIGPFLLKGTIDIGLSGVSWYLDKYYLQNDLFEEYYLNTNTNNNNNNIYNNDGEYNDNYNDEYLKLMWIKNMNNEWYPDEYFYNVGKKSVIHLAYLSINQNSSENESNKIKNKDEIDNAEGMWGVWEISTIGSHYDLQKGGVFRAIIC